jgi:hypothetical protein
MQFIFTADEIKPGEIPIGSSLANSYNNFNEMFVEFIEKPREKRLIREAINRTMIFSKPILKLIKFYRFLRYEIPFIFKRTFKIGIYG